eukprot:CAMPEP_0118713580 /NCGR_PEP_ID=MMETSP0800-20121206/25616_1 /TAXON_ID=210618 ORGANISM="Striatella unipunctata, Strain CCMP2910" /NCGR_SAMPLE_ID=MMETSP0800 /ASSEMBLY_ACC=CAM_ASM_000638 /LENGTH=46 /DNA_ID= /DNA_START= /DNA_END= /DNA_ORIENTATION=
MIKESIWRNSIQNAQNGGGRYDFEMVALIHKDVVKCAGGGGGQDRA